jgi:hypothetical protein
MRTPLQIQASRANGARSRGPVTSAGKLAASRNAEKHGLLSRQILLKSENPEAFLELITALYNEFQPGTPFEESLVDVMAVSRFRQQRIWNIERDATDSQLLREHDKNRAAMFRPAHLTSMAFGTLANETRTLDLLNRYESRFDRQYLRAHRRLLEVQERRLKSGPTLPSPGPQLVPKPAPSPTPSPASEPPAPEPHVSPEPVPALSAPAPAPPMPAPITPSVSAGNLTSISAKRTRPFVRIRYHRRDKQRQPENPNPKSPLSDHNPAKNS